MSGKHRTVDDVGVTEPGIPVLDSSQSRLNPDRSPSLGMVNESASFRLDETRSGVVIRFDDEVAADRSIDAGPVAFHLDAAGVGGQPI